MLSLWWLCCTLSMRGDERSVVASYHGSCFVSKASHLQKSHKQFRYDWFSQKKTQYDYKNRGHVTWKLCKTVGWIGMNLLREGLLNRSIVSNKLANGSWSTSNKNMKLESYSWWKLASMPKIDSPRPCKAVFMYGPSLIKVLMQREEDPQIPNKYIWTDLHATSAMILETDNSRHARCVG
jgi:hypothetical protein